MKIKIVSDLHCDLNNISEFEFMKELDKVDLTLIAGDIAGGYKQELELLSKFKTNKPVICVAGNHLGYNYLYERNIDNVLDGTKINSLYKLRLKYKFPNESNIYYLENEYVEIENKIVFGGCMYTDFNLYGNHYLHKLAGESGLNDFRYVYVYDSKNSICRPVDGDDYIKWFDLFITNLKTCISKTDKDIIVVTHFAPSIKSISSKYNGKYRNLNPSYASDLEEFIKDNPRIKLWVHGHMHDSFDYKIGKCRVVCFPYGYYKDNYILPSEYVGKNIILKEN